MFMTVTIESAVFMRMNHLNNCQSIANTTDLTQTYVRHIYKIGGLSKMRSLDWKQLIGWEKNIHGDTCH